MLSGTRLSDDTGLAHLARHENLSHGVVDLMGTRVVEVLTLEIELAAVFLTHAAGIIKRRRATYIILQQSIVFVLKLLGVEDLLVLILEVMHDLIKDLGDISPTVLSEKSVLIWFHDIYFNVVICLNPP